MVGNAVIRSALLKSVCCLSYYWVSFTVGRPVSHSDWELTKGTGFIFHFSPGIGLEHPLRTGKYVPQQLRVSPWAEIRSSPMGEQGQGSLADLWLPHQTR